MAWHGIANEHSTKRATYISSVKRAFVPKRPCHSQYGSRKSDVPLKVRYSNNPSSFFLFFALSVWTRIRGPRAVTCLPVASYLSETRPTRVSTRGVESRYALLHPRFGAQLLGSAHPQSSSLQARRRRCMHTSKKLHQKHTPLRLSAPRSRPLPCLALPCPCHAGRKCGSGRVR